VLAAYLHKEGLFGRGGSRENVVERSRGVGRDLQKVSTSLAVLRRVGKGVDDAND
jgi:hypothetical protein